MSINDLPSILSGTKSFEPSIPIIKPDFDVISEGVISNIKAILDSNMVTGVNRKVKEFETATTNYFGVPSIATSSCTSGMMLSIAALGLRGKEIIMPSFSFSASAHMAYWNNSPVVFCDINQDSLNIDVVSASQMITENTGAILGVHMYGNPCEVKELEDLCEEKNIKLLFDAAHSFGSTIDNKHVAKFGDATSFSLSPTKLLSTIEGGIVASKDEDLISKLDILRNYGNKPDYTCPIPGLNARMSEINAMVGLEFMKMIEGFVMKRNEVASFYNNELKDLPGIKTQRVKDANRSTYKDYSIFIDPIEFGLSRDELAKALNSAGIATKFYFYPPMHRLEPYQHCKRNKLYNTNMMSDTVLSLPIWNSMNIEVAEKIVNEIRHCHQYAEKIKTLLI